jgi:hypothetical protein
VGFETLTAVVMKSSIFWVITPCGPLEVNRRFGATSRLHIQYQKKPSYLLQAGFSLGIFFDSEVGEDMILRNARLCPNYRVLPSRRPYSQLIIILKTLETDCLIAHVCKIFIQ